MWPVDDIFVLPGVITLLCLNTVSARMGVANPTAWNSLSVIRHLPLTVSDVCLKLGGFQSTTLCPIKTCDYIFYNNFNNKCPITIIFGIVSSQSRRHRKMVSFPTSPIHPRVNSKNISSVIPIVETVTDTITDLLNVKRVRSSWDRCLASWYYRLVHKPNRSTS